MQILLILLRAHNPEVAGSNPAPATEEKHQFLYERLGFFYYVYECSLMYSICRFGARFRHTTLLRIHFWGFLFVKVAVDLITCIRVVIEKIIIDISYSFWLRES